MVIDGKNESPLTCRSWRPGTTSQSRQRYGPKTATQKIILCLRNTVHVPSKFERATSSFDFTASGTVQRSNTPSVFSNMPGVVDLLRIQPFAASLNSHRILIYSLVSTVAVSAAIANALKNHSNFYSVAIYLSKSNRSVLVSLKSDFTLCS
jgi:hypothetical protein